MDTCNDKDEFKGVSDFCCKLCDYTCTTKFNYNRHLSTDKHVRIQKEHKEEITSNYSCNCGKKYKYSQGLSKHKKQCVILEPLKIDTNLVIELLKQNKDKEISDKEMMMTILKENSELKTMILDMCKTMTASAGMCDFPSYIKLKGKKYAKTRRRLYKIRHEKDRHVKGSNGYYADKLLWS